MTLNQKRKTEKWLTKNKVPVQTSGVDLGILKKTTNIFLSFIFLSFKRF